MLDEDEGHLLIVNPKDYSKVKTYFPYKIAELASQDIYSTHTTLSINFFLFEGNSKFPIRKTLYLGLGETDADMTGFWEKVIVPNLRSSPSEFEDLRMSGIDLAEVIYRTHWPLSKDKLEKFLSEYSIKLHNNIKVDRNLSE